MKQTALFVVMICASPAVCGELKISIKEPGGLDRASYPVHGVITLPQSVPANTSFRMMHRGRPVVAQFRPSLPGKAGRKWWVDFATSLKPLESRTYTIVYGPDIKPGPERRGGHVLHTRPKSFVVSNAPYIDWTVPKDLQGLLKSVNFRPSEHLRPNSRGLMLRDKSGAIHPLGGPGTKATVVRHGRMTVALRFEKTESKRELHKVRWKVDLIFPGPVSWVEVRLQVDDPQGKVDFAGLEFNLNLDKPSGRQPTLVEYGASSVVYTYLTGNMEMHLRASARARNPWQVLRGSPTALRTFAVAAAPVRPAEGWAHVMDRKRCLGLSVYRFAQDSPESMRISAAGKFVAWKQMPKKKSRRLSWRSWYHFLHFPHHSSARASPQQMQHPVLFKQP